MESYLHWRLCWGGKVFEKNKDDDKEKKRNYLLDLSLTLDEDIKQIKNLIGVLNNSENLIIELQNDIDKNESSMSYELIINKIIEIDR